MQYLNILVESLETCHIRYLYNCQPLPCASNSSSIAQAIVDAVRFFGIKRNSFCILLSDAVKYMVAAGAILISKYSKLFHRTCVTHLLHKCAMKVKFHFEHVDQVITKVKSATAKNKTRPAKFANVGCSPQPAVAK